MFAEDVQPEAGWVLAHIDGGARGNPGPAGFGVHLQDGEGRVLAELSEYLGRTTNNVAEYSALLAALDYALRHGHAKLKVVSDSELMVKQIKGQYKVNSPDLRPLYERAKQAIGRLETFRITHVLREQNKHADRLANEAMDRGGARPSAAAAPPAPRTGSEPVVRRTPPKTPAERREFRGIMRGGVVELISGDIPEGTLVRVVVE